MIFVRGDKCRRLVVYRSILSGWRTVGPTNRKGRKGRLQKRKGRNDNYSGQDGLMNGKRKEKSRGRTGGQMYLEDMRKGNR